MNADFEFERQVRHAKIKLRDGTAVEAEYVAVIDWALVRELVERAAQNTSRNAKSGPLRVRVIAINHGTLREELPR